MLGRHPLFKEINGTQHQEFEVGDTVFANESDLDLTEDKGYVVEDFNGVYVQITNDKGVKDYYSCEHFSLSVHN